MDVSYLCQYCNYYLGAPETTPPPDQETTESSSKGISQPHSKVDHSKDELAVLE